MKIEVNCVCMYREGRGTLLGDPHCRSCAGSGVVLREATQREVSESFRRDGFSASELARYFEEADFDDGVPASMLREAPRVPEVDQ